MTVEAFAPAKINLTLHVTGRRADGYHLLDSLVVFVDVGDRLRVRSAEAMALRVTGPMAAGVPVDGGNLVMRAADLFEPAIPAEIVLDKHLPAAAGIGGGSSDAAATLRALAMLAGRPLPPVAALVALGADVPVCLHHRPRRMRGIGDVLDDVAPLPPLHVVLANPGVPTPTGAVFTGLRSHDNAPMPEALPAFAGAGAVCDWLATQRNDLQAPAMALVPQIAACLDALAGTDGCLLARMSGSGATCVGCFASRDAAGAAARAIGASHPDWWVAAGSVMTQDAPLHRAWPGREALLVRPS